MIGDTEPADEYDAAGTVAPEQLAHRFHERVTLHDSFDVLDEWTRNAWINAARDVLMWLRAEGARP